MVVQYKPGPQAHFLVERMAESEKTVLEVLSKLTDKMTSVERKLESYHGDLTAVQTKVDLMMRSNSLVQQEQI
jgi:hypothetical protein